MQIFQSIISFFSIISAITPNLELVAALLSLWCVWLAAKNNILNWPVAMLGSIGYIFVFTSVKLYSDAMLNTIFLAFQAYGWYAWNKENKSKVNGSETALSVSVLKPKLGVGLFAIALIIYYPWIIFISQWLPNQHWILLGYSVQFHAPMMPYLDAAMMFVSLIALYLQSKRILFHWYLWILVDLVYVPIYIKSETYYTAILYAIYIPMAIAGLKLWKAQLRPESNS